MLYAGVCSYGLRLCRGVPYLAAVYVPFGLGSGICGVMAARDAVGSAAEVIGVVAANAPAYALSYAAGEPVSTNSADTMADGMACRIPVPGRLDPHRSGAAGVVPVTGAEITAAMPH